MLMFISHLNLKKVRLLNYFLSTTLIIVLFSSCQTESIYYEKKFTEQEKKDLSIQLIEGRGWYYQGTPAEQLVFEEARLLDPSYADPYRELGVPYLKRGFAVEFEKYYQKAVEHDPLNWQGWRAYLYLYFYRDYDRAIVDLDATDVLTPDFVDYPQALSVDYMRGICYMQKRDYKKAFEYFNKHIEFEMQETGLEYMESIAFLQRGFCYLQTEDVNKALHDFEQGLSINPNSADLNYWVSKALILKGDYDQAEKHLSIALDLFQKGNFNQRAYVEEFNQIYLEDITRLSKKIPESIY